MRQRRKCMEIFTSNYGIFEHLFLLWPYFCIIEKRICSIRMGKETPRRMQLSFWPNITLLNLINCTTFQGYKISWSSQNHETINSIIKFSDYSLFRESFHRESQIIYPTLWMFTVWLTHNKSLTPGCLFH